MNGALDDEEMTAEKPRLWVRIVLLTSAVLLILPLLALTESERPVPNYYVDEIQVTGLYTREDFEDLVRVVRHLRSEETVWWISVPFKERRAFARGEHQLLPSDVAEVGTIKPEGVLAGSQFKLRKRQGVWSVVETSYWIR